MTCPGNDMDNSPTPLPRVVKPLPILLASEGYTQNIAFAAFFSKEYSTVSPGGRVRVVNGRVPS
jgi:hypothetical protein